MSNERRISATIKRLSSPSEWCVVKLFVSSTNLKRPLAGEVTFHLHPTCKKDTKTVSAINGKAELELVAWGAFTIGAECDDGTAKLELDLTTLPDTPDTFRSR